jgi:hypothetical protein
MTIPIKYPKIPSPFRRHEDGPDKNKFDFLRWTSREAELLSRVEDWTWTEKLDGTNIRIYWDGHTPEFGGRTDQAQLPGPLASWLTENITEELLEQTFGSTQAILFGEGIGPKIQNGERYGDVRVVLFDVLVTGACTDGHGIWLERPSVGGVADSLGLKAVPVLTYGSPESVIAAYRAGDFFDSITAALSTKTTMPAAGIVGTAPHGLLDRRGERIQLKVKVKDFRK